MFHLRQIQYDMSLHCVFTFLSTFILNIAFLMRIDLFIVFVFYARISFNDVQIVPENKLLNYFYNIIQYFHDTYFLLQESAERVLLLLFFHTLSF